MGSRRVEVVDLSDDDEPSRRQRRSRFDVDDGSANSLVNKERMLGALEAIQSKMDELRRIDNHIPAPLLDEFNNLLQNLSTMDSAPLPVPAPAPPRGQQNNFRGRGRPAPYGGGPPRSGIARSAMTPGPGSSSASLGRGRPPHLNAGPAFVPGPGPGPGPNPSLTAGRRPDVGAQQHGRQLAGPAQPLPPAPAPPRKPLPPWSSSRKIKLLNRAARFSVEGVEALDAHGNLIAGPLPADSPAMQNARGSVSFIPRMMDADKWYQCAVRGRGASLEAGGPFPFTVKGLPTADGLDLSQTVMPKDLAFGEPGVPEIGEFQLDERDKMMLDTRAVQEWENRSHKTKCIEKLAAQLREVSAIQAVAVDCLRKQMSGLWVAVKELQTGLDASDKNWDQKVKMIGTLNTLEATVQDLETTTTMVCNRSTVFFNVASRSSRKLLLDRLDLGPAVRHALLHSPSSRSLFTDAFKWIMLGPSLVLAKPYAVMGLKDPGVHLAQGKLGDPIATPSFDPHMPLPVVGYKPAAKAPSSEPRHRPLQDVCVVAAADRPSRVEVPADSYPSRPIFPAAAAAVDEESRRRRFRDDSPVRARNKSPKRGGDDSSRRNREKVEDRDRDRDARREREREQEREKEREQGRERDRERDSRRRRRSADPPEDSPGSRRRRRGDEESRRTSRSRSPPLRPREDLRDVMTKIASLSPSRAARKEKEKRDRRPSSPQPSASVAHRRRSRSADRDERRRADQSPRREPVPVASPSEQPQTGAYTQQVKSMMSQIMGLIAEGKKVGNNQRTRSRTPPRSSSPLSRFLAEGRLSMNQPNPGSRF